MYQIGVLSLFILKHVAAVTVSVEQGMLKGEQKLTITGDATYYSFKGIPYAAPPTGRWRFMAPRPPHPWKGILNATQHGNVCPQVDALQNMMFVPGSEDCLFLNVYSPCLHPQSPLAVLFYIHGGGYGFGNGNDAFYGPDFLMNAKNVVVVTFNYRLDTLGFLCLDTKEVPGNAGMKDQVAALKWVQKNIRNFGGDPNKVTIIGESAGASSATLHALSSMSRGLFQRVIAMSATPLSEFSIEFEQTRRAYMLGNNLGCNTTDPKKLLKYLQAVPVNQLLDTNTSIIAAEIYIDFLAKTYYFVPVVEKDFGQERFLTESPVVSIKNGRHRVDILLGYTSAEGIVGIPFIENSLTIENYKRYPEVLLPRRIFYESTPKMHMKLSDLIKAYYTGSRLTSLETMKQIITYFTDIFSYPVIKYARYLSNFNRNNNIYMYEFASMSNRNFLRQEGIRYGLDGVAHSDDIHYLFNANAYNLPIDDYSSQLIQQFIAVLTNFAIYGNPTPDSSLGITWPKYSADCEEYAVIGQNLTIAMNPKKTMVNFWEHIYELAVQTLSGFKYE